VPPMPTMAIVAYQGVLADETEAFRFVLSRIPGTRVVMVGERLGTVAGPGGAQVVDATFAEVGAPDVVVVPGGLGCHRSIEIAVWLRSVQPRWLLASSTGSALLATAGLLRDVSAATHWLAASILERHGAHPSPERLVVAGHIVTSTGRASAVDAALVVARSFGGDALVEHIVHELAELREEVVPVTPHPRRRHLRRRPRWAVTIDAASDGAPDAGFDDGPVMMIELEELVSPARTRRRHSG
jgi:transcriptional regulator GlxA family with amidase domain